MRILYLKCVSIFSNSASFLFSKIFQFFHDFNMLLKKDGAAAVVEGMQTVLGLVLGDRLGAKRKDTMPVLEADKATACARRKKRMFIKTC